MPLAFFHDNDVTMLPLKAASVLEALVADKKTPVLLLLSGGSSFNVLDHMTLSSASHITFGMLDERLSSHTKENNFLQLTATNFYTTLIKEGANALDTTVQEGMTLQDLVEIMTTGILTWKQLNKEGKIVILQGIGPDGHTAGIMPYPENEQFFMETFNNNHQLVVGYDAKQKNPIPLRVTVTLPFLREHVDASVVYVVGNTKKEALTHVMSEHGTTFCTPGRIVKEMKSVTLVTDITI